MRSRLLLALFCVVAGCKPRSTEPLRIAAASDLTLAFAEVGKTFEKKSGTPVDFSFGSTGLLAKQISEGAPFDVFAAANVSFVDDVVKAGACDGSTKTLYARGRLVIWASDVARVPRTLAELAEPKYAKIAIAHPEHAPYGRAAKEALTKAGLWERIEPRAVYGENIQQTLTFASTGNADLALVALSLVAAAPDHWLAIDPALHAPLDQALVVCGKKRKEARDFVDLVGSAEGRAVLDRFGFSLPTR